jgi:tetratricopeptide (TPR) repeat protein
MDANQQALLAASYQRLEEHDSAIRYYQLSLKQDSSNAKNWIGLGISQEHIAALEDALNSYQQAAKRGNLNNRLRAFIAKRSKTLRQVLN